MSAEPRLSFGGVLRSEWIKLRSLRSTLWCYVILVVLTVGLAALTAVAVPTDGGQGPAGRLVEGGDEPTWLGLSTVGVAFGQLVIVVLGALVITGEYGTGMIRSTFAAVPRRLPALLAKALVFGALTLVVTGISLVAATLLSGTILDGRGLDIDLGDPGVWWGVAGATGYVVLIGLLALALGTIIRASAGGIATALGLVLVVPIVVNLIASLTQATWLLNAAAFLPSSAGGAMYTYEPVASFDTDVWSLDGIQGLLVMLAWVVVTSVVAGVLVRRRDA